MLLSILDLVPPCQRQPNDLFGSNFVQVSSTANDPLDIRVLLEEFKTEEDDDEAALLSQTRDELVAELEQRRHCNNETNNKPPSML